MTLCSNIKKIRMKWNYIMLLYLCAFCVLTNKWWRFSVEWKKEEKLNFLNAFLNFAYWKGDDGRIFMVDDSEKMYINVLKVILHLSIDNQQQQQRKKREMNLKIKLFSISFPCKHKFFHLLFLFSIFFCTSSKLVSILYVFFFCYLCLLIQ